MSVKAEVLEKPEEQPANPMEAFVNENKWAVCHSLFFF